jgi:hypothetical protein
VVRDDDPVPRAPTARARTGPLDDPGDLVTENRSLFGAGELVRVGSADPDRGDPNERAIRRDARERNLPDSRAAFSIGQDRAHAAPPP